MTAVTKLTANGQIVIPKRARALLRWRAATRLQVETLRDGSVRLWPATRSPAAKAENDSIDLGFGFLRKGDPVSELEAEHRVEIAADERRTRRR